MKRFLALLAVAALAAAAYQFGLRDTTLEPRLLPPRAAATIGAGEEAVGVSPDGRILDWLAAPADDSLPSLPLATPPDRRRLRGPMLQQARVLGAVPPPLRPHVAGSRYGESGVEVELRSGIELRFGDASRAAEKWRAAVAVLADPSITALDYVDLHAPSRPAVGGSGHPLPPLP